MYKGLFNEKNFMSIVEYDSFKIVGKKPTGIYDKYILCQKCDNEVIGAYESYASKILQGENLSNKIGIKIKNYVEEKGAGKLEVENIDYKKFKLFLLSILWRGHISKNNFFEDIDLGNKYGEEVRRMILEGNPKEETDFEIMVVMYKDSFVPAKMLVPTRKFRMNKSICYLIHIYGISFVFKVSSGYKLEYFENAKIKKNNTAQIYLLDGQVAKDIFEKTTGVSVP